MVERSSGFRVTVRFSLHKTGQIAQLGNLFKFVPNMQTKTLFRYSLTTKLQAVALVTILLPNQSL
jgi:hypothetical protein